MFTRLRQQWQDVTRARPGTRFRQRYRARQVRRRCHVAKVLVITAGLLLFLLGIVLLPAPGPGFLVIFVGAAMIAEESYWAASALDAIERKGWRVFRWMRKAWRRASLALKAASIVLASAIVTGAGWATLHFVT
jgi:uncharacterized protein (TIGR02611 family)